MMLSRVSLRLGEKAEALYVSDEVNLVEKIAQRSRWIARWRQKQARLFCAPTGIHIGPMNPHRAAALHAVELRRSNSSQD
jgi:hypothetical protein